MQVSGHSAVSQETSQPASLEALSPGRSWPLKAVIGGVLAVFFAVPFLQSDFLTYLALRILILSLFAVSFNLLLGFTGLLSFGQAAFYAIGGYAAGIILKSWCGETIIGVLGGAVIAGIAAALVGYFCVKRTRIYFSMLTLAFGMLIYVILYKWKALTGGTEGLTGIPRGRLLWLIDMLPLQNFYYFALILVTLCLFLLFMVVNSHFGLILQGIRENENRIRFAGIKVKRFRIYVFTVAGFFSGVAGSLYALLERTMFPSISDWQSSAEPIMVALIGGINNFAGPIVGSFIFVGLKEIVVRFTEQWLLVFGIILVLMLLGFRDGIVANLLAKFAHKGS